TWSTRRDLDQMPVLCFGPPLTVQVLYVTDCPHAPLAIAERKARAGAEGIAGIELGVNDAAAAQASWVYKIDWVVTDVGIEVEGLRIADPSCLHPGRIWLSESCLQRMITTIHGVIQAHRITALVTGEASVGCSGRLGIECGPERERYLLLHIGAVSV